MSSILWLHGLIFYIFAGIMVISSLLVITLKNPVHAILFLVLTFLTASGLFILIGAEFLGFILIVVYVGAVAIFFLFVVMLMDLDMSSLKTNLVKSLPFALIICGIFLVELIMVFINAKLPNNNITEIAETQEITNTEALGQVIYTKYVYAFEVGGLILLVGMIGAIVLSMRDKNLRSHKIQIIEEQNARSVDNSISIIKNDRRG